MWNIVYKAKRALETIHDVRSKRIKTAKTLTDKNVFQMGMNHNDDDKDDEPVIINKPETAVFIQDQSDKLVNNNFSVNQSRPSMSAMRIQSNYNNKNYYSMKTDISQANNVSIGQDNSF